MRKPMTIKSLFLYLARSAGMFALFRHLTRGAPRILCYHGGSLGDEHEFNAKLFCQPGLLEQRLDWLRRKGYTPCGLDDLLRGGPRATLPVVVTLDDGWYSSATDLLPVLARYGHAPTLYLATKVFTDGGPVIEVGLRYLLWSCRRETVDLDGFSAALDGHHVLAGSGRSRLCALAETWLKSFAGDAGATTAALERLALACAVPLSTLNLASRRFHYMNAAELRSAAAHGCRIELHGHVHQYLPGDEAANLADIAACRATIIGAGLPAPRHYCYPSGAYDQRAPATMVAAGVSTATTCVPGLVHGVGGVQRYFLPRFLDGGSVSALEFEAEMSGVLEFIRTVTGRNDRSLRDFSWRRPAPAPAAPVHGEALEK